MGGIGVQESECSEVALEQKNHRRGDGWHKKTGHQSQTTSERDRAIMDFSVAGLVNQPDTKAHFLPKRQRAERQREAAHHGEQIDVEGEHGGVKSVETLKRKDSSSL